MAEELKYHWNDALIIEIWFKFWNFWVIKSCLELFQVYIPAQPYASTIHQRGTNAAYSFKALHRIHLFMQA